MVDKKEILNQIVNVLEKPFVTHGFPYICIIPRPK